ncbi:hypothetical protein D3C87_1610360 [compost metagenome]
MRGGCDGGKGRRRDLRGKALRAGVIEVQHGHGGLERGAAGLVHEGQGDIRVAQHVVDVLLRLLDIDGHGHESGAHDAEVGDQVLGAVERGDGDAGARLQAPCGQPRGHAAGKPVGLAVGQVQGRAGLAQVDDGGQFGGEPGIGQVAQVLERMRHGENSGSWRLSAFAAWG